MKDQRKKSSACKKFSVCANTTNTQTWIFEKNIDRQKHTDKDENKSSQRKISDASNRTELADETCMNEGKKGQDDHKFSQKENVKDILTADQINCDNPHSKPTLACDTEKCIKYIVKSSVTDHWEHVVFDLKRIADILELIITDEHFTQIYECDVNVSPKLLQERINNVLDV